MKVSVKFYRDVLGMQLFYGGEQSSFSSLRASDAESAILNLEQGDVVQKWGRLILHVTDVDAFWKYLREKGFDPQIPKDASWGERYFHMNDPDGHEHRLLGDCNDGRDAGPDAECTRLRDFLGMPH